MPSRAPSSRWVRRVYDLITNLSPTEPQSNPKERKGKERKEMSDHEDAGKENEDETTAARYIDGREFSIITIPDSIYQPCRL